MGLFIFFYGFKLGCNINKVGSIDMDTFHAVIIGLTTFGMFLASISAWEVNKPAVSAVYTALYIYWFICLIKGDDLSDI